MSTEGQKPGADPDLTLSRLIDRAVPADTMPSVEQPAEWLRGGLAEPLGAADSLGRYRLCRLLGEGGMGSVFEAEQLHPVRRRVAVKLIKLGMDTRQVVARFEAERQALAVMNHPGIAKVFDAGVTAQGRSFFAMELVEGDPITHYCDEQQLPVRQRLELFIQVCDAVQHAHQKGIIHRDLKPSNVLVTLRDGQPVVKVIDFGIAKAVAGSLGDITLTAGVDGPDAAARMIGTPHYMSPEQAAGDVDRIDTRTDVYALGVLLYELLGGVRPFTPREGSLPLEDLRFLIRHTDPPRPSSALSKLATTQREIGELARRRGTQPHALLRTLRRELEWIPLKAMRKDPAERYGSAVELAQDVRHYLDDLPISARPPTLAYQARKFVHRNRVVVTALAAVGVALVVAIAGTSWGMVQANHARRMAELHAGRASRTNDFLSDMLSLPNPYAYTGGPDVTVVEMLGEAVERIPGSFAGDPESEADVLQTIGSTYRNVGRYIDAETQFRRALELNRAHRGERHPATLRVASLLGLTCADQDKLAESEALLRETLAAQEQVLGADHRDALATLNGLAWTLFLSGKSHAAEPMLERVLEARRRTAGSDAPETLKTMTNLAVVRIRQDKDDERTARLARQGADGLAASLGPAHPDAIYARHVVAWGLWRGGQLEPALAAYRPVLEQARATFGSSHPHTLFWTGNVVQLLVDMERLDDAESLAMRALEDARAAYGSDHARTRQAAELLATVYDAADRSADADVVRESFGVASDTGAL